MPTSGHQKYLLWWADFFRTVSRPHARQHAPTVTMAEFPHPPQSQGVHAAAAPSTPGPLTDGLQRHTPSCSTALMRYTRAAPKNKLDHHIAGQRMQSAPGLLDRERPL